VFDLVPADRSAEYRRFDQEGTQPHTDGYYEVAVALAAKLTATSKQLSVVVGDCATDGNTQNDASCVAEFIKRFGALALRRPLVADEVAFYGADVYNSASSVLAESLADRMTTLLLAPQLLYIIEDQLPAADGDPELFPLGPYELASRLSFHFWNRMPDEQLFAAAADGSLSTEKGYIDQVKRLFQHARSPLRAISTPAGLTITAIATTYRLQPVSRRCSRGRALG